MNNTYIKARGGWIYLYRAINKAGATLDLMFSARRNLKDAHQFFPRGCK
jgi:putative transposase